MIKAMCLSNATSFLMLHNHPGGSLSPSKQDVEITDRMARLGSLLHIPLCDHLIVIPESNRYFSFKNRGVLTFKEPIMKTEYTEIVIPDIVAAEPPEVREEDQLWDKLSYSENEDEELEEEESPSFCLS